MLRPSLQASSEAQWQHVLWLGKYSLKSRVTGWVSTHGLLWSARNF